MNILDRHCARWGHRFDAHPNKETGLTVPVIFAQTFGFTAQCLHCRKFATADYKMRRRDKVNRPNG